MSLTTDDGADDGWADDGASWTGTNFLLGGDYPGGSASAAPTDDATPAVPSAQGAGVSTAVLPGTIDKTLMAPVGALDRDGVVDQTSGATPAAPSGAGPGVSTAVLPTTIDRALMAPVGTLDRDGVVDQTSGATPAAPSGAGAGVSTAVLPTTIDKALMAPVGTLTRDHVLDQAGDMLARLPPELFRQVLGPTIDFTSDLPDDDAGLRGSLERLRRRFPTAGQADAAPAGGFSAPDPNAVDVSGPGRIPSRGHNHGAVERGAPRSLKPVLHASDAYSCARPALGTNPEADGRAVAGAKSGDVPHVNPEPPFQWLRNAYGDFLLGSEIDPKDPVKFLYPGPEDTNGVASYLGHRIVNILNGVADVTGDLLRPRAFFPDINDPVASAAAEENNRRHPFPFDPNHVATPKEQRRLAGQIPQDLVPIGAWDAAAEATAQAELALVKDYGTLSRELSGTGFQAHHLNQGGVYGYGAGENYIARTSGLSIPMKGSAFQAETQHNIAHEVIDDFGDPFRRAADSEGKLPLNWQYGDALEASLRKAGISRRGAQKIADLAADERIDAGFAQRGKVPRIPRRVRSDRKSK